MTKTVAFIVALAFFAVGSTALALYSVSETGKWPKDWPSELEPLRKQSRTLVGPTLSARHFAVRFTDRNEFEAAWPYLLKVKSQGAPIFLVREPNFFLGKNQTGAVIHCPPGGQWDNPNTPEAPIEGYAEESRSRWGNTNYIELVVDGRIVDLNRIRLPSGTPIIDERFKADSPASQSPTSTSKAEIVKDNHQGKTTFGTWSAPTNFLSARFVVTLEEYEAADSPSYFRYSVVLEVRNDHGADLAFVNQPSFENIEVRDTGGRLVNVLSGDGNHRQGEASWAVILPYTYVGLRVDTTIPVDVGLSIGGVSPDKRSLTATLISKKRTGAEAYWFGEMEPPPAKEWVGEIQVPAVLLPVP